MIIIITSCSASKDDSIPIPNCSRVVQPSYYLDNKGLISRLHSIRERIFQDPKARVGTKTTYAFDLYVRAGKAYGDLFKNNYYRVKSRLLSSNDIEWFFMSGGYGIIHALEGARRYQATFNRNIAYQNNIPFTTNLWNDILPTICDAILLKFDPDWVYVFGSRDYTQFVKRSDFYKIRNNIKIFESTGSAGSTWLSPILNDCLRSILSHNAGTFSIKYGKFVKQ